MTNKGVTDNKKIKKKKKRQKDQLNYCSDLGKRWWLPVGGMVGVGGEKWFNNGYKLKGRQTGFPDGPAVRERSS